MKTCIKFMFSKQITTAGLDRMSIWVYIMRGPHIVGSFFLHFSLLRARPAISHVSNMQVLLWKLWPMLLQCACCLARAQCCWEIDLRSIHIHAPVPYKYLAKCTRRYSKIRWQDSKYSWAQQDITKKNSICLIFKRRIKLWYQTCVFTFKFLQLTRQINSGWHVCVRCIGIVLFEHRQ